MTLVDSYECAPETAGQEFELILSKTRHNDVIKAHHLIQSFLPGEIEAPDAHIIGNELAGRLLEGKYSYVCATHTDKNHIHNHIIFCAADNVNHKKYHDCKKSYYHIRDLSDELCREHKFSVIKGQNGMRKVFKEWMEEKKGSSWKFAIKKDINAAVKKATSYDVFLRILRDQGYQIRGGRFERVLAEIYLLSASRQGLLNPWESIHPRR